jgi:hypothetical protein
MRIPRSTPDSTCSRVRDLVLEEGSTSCQIQPYNRTRLPPRTGPTEGIPRTRVPWHCGTMEPVTTDKTSRWDSGNSPHTGSTAPSGWNGYPRVAIDPGSPVETNGLRRLLSCAVLSLPRFSGVYRGIYRGFDRCFEGPASRYGLGLVVLDAWHMCDVSQGISEKNRSRWYFLVRYADFRVTDD